MALSISDLKALFQRNQSYLFQDGEINTPLLHRLAQECNSDLVSLLCSDDGARCEHKHDNRQFDNQGQQPACPAHAARAVCAQSQTYLH